MGIELQPLIWDPSMWWRTDKLTLNEPPTDRTVFGEEDAGGEIKRKKTKKKQQGQIKPWAAFSSSSSNTLATAGGDWGSIAAAAAAAAETEATRYPSQSYPFWAGVGFFYLNFSLLIFSFADPPRAFSLQIQDLWLKYDVCWRRPWSIWDSSRIFLIYATSFMRSTPLIISPLHTSISRYLV